MVRVGCARCIGGLTADQRQNDSKGDRADHGCFSARVSIVTCTDIPGRRRSLFCPSLTVIRTGMRWAILTKLPVALSGDGAELHPGRRGDTLHLAVEGLAVERVYGEGDRLANAYFGQLGL